MESVARKAVIIALMRALAAAGSWCGETHVQKAVFMAQSLTGLPTDYNYILYKHGPFSFDLRDELATMRAENLVELIIRSPEYGPAIVPTENSANVENAAAGTLAEFQAGIAFVASAVGKKGVAELERLATALYISPNLPGGSPVELGARKLKELKPHISEADEIAATKEARELMESASRTG